MSGFFEAIYRLVRQVPPGKVVSYGQIALYLGRPRASRIVGCAMHAAPGDVPCHRVVNREGRTAPAFSVTGTDLQRLFLEEEGVGFLAVFGRLRRILGKQNPRCRKGFRAAGVVF